MTGSKIQDLINLVAEREQGNDDLAEDIKGAQAELDALREELQQTQVAAEILKRTAEARGACFDALLEQKRQLDAVARAALRHLEAWHHGKFEAEKQAARAALGEIKP